jgi:acetyl-CoA synthetase
MLQHAESYERLIRDFRWRIPERYNIGVDVADRQRADGLALVYIDAAGAVREYRFGEVAQLSNRLANVFAAAGLAAGDRVAILLGQAPETALAHVAAWKGGMISLPLFTLFGEEALAYRLADSGARALVTDREGLAKVAPLRDRLPALEHVFLAEDLPKLLERAADRFAAVDTAADDPAVIIYTSGTTGSPKGALHAHRVLLGHLPGVELPHELFPAPGDRMWTPADWAWIGGLFDVLMPAWHHGVPVVAHRARKFDPDAAMHLIARHEVRNVFFPPTALKLMRQERVTAPAGFRLRSVGSGGETLGAGLLDWGRATLGVTINEFYGQTECNLVVSNCAALYAVRAGSMGRPAAGHDVRIVDDRGKELPRGTAGNIAIRRPDPVMFLGYWGRPEATAEKFAGDWLLTGDLGRQDEDGHLWFVGRDDDVITSGGYRIGPGEIEDCLMRHPAVALAAAVGVPDPLRTEIVKAFIVLRPGVAGSDALAREIQDFVKTRLAAHEYPREVAFVAALPMTATGKIIRRALREAGAP